eukprot:scaffold17111_cov36-Tisochrysis_lutea.AAC.5
MRLASIALLAALGALLLLGCGVRLTHFRRETRRTVVSEPGRSLGRGGCLITKWGAVWLLDERRQRLYVADPPEGCEQRAAVVESDDLSAFPKAYDGGSGYTLSEEQRLEACKRPACTGPALTLPLAAAHVATSGSVVNDPAGTPPANGWGMGPADGWMEHSPLRYNQIAKQASTTPASI